MHIANTSVRSGKCPQQQSTNTPLTPATRTALPVLQWPCLSLLRAGRLPRLPGFSSGRASALWHFTLTLSAAAPVRCSPQQTPHPPRCFGCIYKSQPAETPGDVPPLLATPSAYDFAPPPRHRSLMLKPIALRRLFAFRNTVKWELERPLRCVNSVEIRFCAQWPH